MKTLLNKAFKIFYKQNLISQYPTNFDQFGTIKRKSYLSKNLTSQFPTKNVNKIDLKEITYTLASSRERTFFLQKQSEA